MRGAEVDEGGRVVEALDHLNRLRKLVAADLLAEGGGVALRLGAEGRVRVDELERGGGGARDVRGEASAEDVAGRGEALVVNDGAGAAAEAANGAEGGAQGANVEGDIGDRNAKVLGGAAAGLAEDAEAHRIVENDAELVFLAEADNLLEVADVAGVAEDTLGDDELAGGAVLAGGLGAGVDGGHQLLELKHVIVVVVFDVGAAKGGALLDGDAARLVHEDLVAAGGEGGDDRGDGGERIRVEGGVLDTHEGADIVLNIKVGLDGAVEAAGAGAADAVDADGGLGDLSNVLVDAERVEVEGAEVNAASGGGERVGGEVNVLPAAANHLQLRQRLLRVGRGGGARLEGLALEAADQLLALGLRRGVEGGALLGLVVRHGPEVDKDDDHQHLDHHVAGVGAPLGEDELEELVAALAGVVKGVHRDGANLGELIDEHSAQCVFLLFCGLTSLF